MKKEIPQYTILSYDIAITKKQLEKLLKSKAKDKCILELSLKLEK